MPTLTITIVADNGFEDHNGDDAMGNNDDVDGNGVTEDDIDDDNCVGTMDGDYDNKDDNGAMDDYDDGNDEDVDGNDAMDDNDDNNGEDCDGQ